MHTGISLQVRLMENIIYCKTSNTSPGLYWNKWPGPPACIGETRLLIEIQLVVKHCQLAILNFLVYMVYSMSNTKHNKQPCLFTFHFVETVRLFGLLLPQLAPGGPQLVMETRLLLEQVMWTNTSTPNLYWRPSFYSRPGFIRSFMVIRFS